ncbi:hypothetical protein DPMN_098445 [Dreissena polymorpha]|uniref:Uncharacterized protein n=1 Tax=Dreissena polymorpha TaxID=45954 RepID=A0A9D4R5H6_DREPO|nr:hypothetical protein DPMN_098445 [Dreissena polymorpha]
MMEKEVEFDLDDPIAVLEPLPEQMEYTNYNILDTMPSKPLTYSKEMRPNRSTEEDFMYLVRSLNEKQKDVFQYLSN